MNFGDDAYIVVTQWQWASCCLFPRTEGVWNPKSAFDCCVLVSNQKDITGTEQTYRHMIVLAEWEYIILVFCSLQETLSQTVLLLLRRYITERTQKPDCYLLCFWKGSLIIMPCSGKVSSLQVVHWSLIRLIGAELGLFFSLQICCCERKMERLLLVASCLSYRKSRQWPLTRHSQVCSISGQKMKPSEENKGMSNHYTQNIFSSDQ